MDRVQLAWGCRGDEDLTCLTTKSPGTPDTHLIDLGRMKGCATFKPPYGFEPGISGLINVHPNH